MRTVLVTGGAGFIGSHIADALVARGDRVRVLDNLSAGNLANLESVRSRVEFIQGDVADPEAVRKAVAGADCVFHAAAIASVPMSLEKPLDVHAACATGTLNILDAARRAGVRRLVYSGSSSAYGDTPTSAKRENDLPVPISPYAAAKLSGEAYCQAFAHAFGLETVCLRYFNVFGPRQDPDSPYSAVIPLFIRAMVRGQRPKIYGDGQQSRDFVYVGNVVQANLLASSVADVSGGIFNVGMGQATTLLALVSAINDSLGMDIEPEFLPPRAGDIRDSMADITLTRQKLGYDPHVNFADGLRASIDYYRELVGEGGTAIKSG